MQDQYGLCIENEDYLYPQSYFVMVDVPHQAHAILRAAE